MQKCEKRRKVVLMNLLSFLYVTTFSYTGKKSKFIFITQEVKLRGDFFSLYLIPLFGKK